MPKNNRCPICGKSMDMFKGVPMCVNCNDRYGEYYNFFANAVDDYKGEDGKDKVLIECPGATLYDNTNSRIVEGAQWNDPGDFSQGYKIVGKQVFAPNHQARRLIDKDKIENICRCQACQDLTIRMRTYNNQKMRDEYTQDSPLMPKLDQGDKFSPIHNMQ